MRRAVLLRLLVCGLLLAFAGCGPASASKPPAHATNDSETPPARTWEWNWKGLRELIQVYYGDVGVTRDQADDLIRKYWDSPVLKPPAAPAQAGSVAEVLDTAWGFETSGSGRLTPDELSDERIASSPVLRWLPPNSVGLSCAELGKAIALDGRGASDSALSGLTRILCWLDSRAMHGSGDSRISRRELASGGWFQGIWWASRDLPAANKSAQPKTPAPWHWLWPSDSESSSRIEWKLTQQSMARYDRWTSALLSEQDRRMEWVALVMRGFIAWKIAQGGSDVVGANPWELDAILQVEGLDPSTVGRKARTWYDHPIAGGNNNGRLEPRELFNLLTDVEFAGRLSAVTAGDFRLGRWDEIAFRDQYWQVLFGPMPRLRAAWGLDGGNQDDVNRRRVLWSFWETFQSYDSTARGGNGDGTMDPGEVLLAWNSALVIEQWLWRKDANHNGTFEPAEAQSLIDYLVKSEPGIGQAIDTESPLLETKPDDDVWGWVKHNVLGQSRPVVATAVTPVQLYAWFAEVITKVKGW